MHFLRRLRARFAPLPAIDAPLWLAALAPYPFLTALSLAEQARLRALAALFLQRKEFSGAHGLEVSDAMALQIAAQACLPLLHLDPPEKAITWYDDFVGIVVQPGDALARRSAIDEAGVVHHYHEELMGEAMQGGPIMLSWQAVQQCAHSWAHGHNVVVHECAHKIDMRNGRADGYPPLPAGFMGEASASAARQRWHDAWAPAYAAFREQTIIAQRFGGPRPWLDAYGATAPEEFFAVACEAYCVQRTRFAAEFPALAPLLDGLFRRPGL
ncbi:zinc-dependent peptidase [Acidovorax sp. HDW3]|uniref:M90 family metallopeptidase n=1 Tax=Acidovorax sp. HDW3 TaxID=2714923 RepID=UPI0014090055|nr:M90 family metallopeptidase [Acidovorax sp. HDW3]QIL43586.1 zinc-dependent peptidase [Acidovorax sp. HDW3]